ncbi:hypothetical protein AMAG_18672 [Allomyces macrogynus ATCC 38327]|uniref:HMG domain-containing protein n=1 Tax=Allomyces macrogynus (strain ATCC 38327) TaxID=578462 RepID=A0A0L0SGW3_ALLM3|nr:hypothetical protein, variant [Allomyces macrogynus ATCC 38327]KNE61689.1 hypothetical protein AMAG_18672 [Allomyces macrogynus ATCC 38327]|eukprot:KNE61688.1 hypothetical protein, variant [Allomyces macrogynus ATCC 38327]
MSFFDQFLDKRFPAPSTCPKCGSLAIETFYINKAVVFGTVFLESWSVPVSTCACSPTSTISFDGHELGIINANNHILFTYEFATEYLDLKDLLGASVSAWLATKVQDQDAHLIAANMSRDDRLWRLARWNSYGSKISTYLALVATLFEIPSTLFNCCNAPVITLDGTVISIKSSRLAALTEPWVIPSSASAKYKPVTVRYAAPSRSDSTGATPVPARSLPRLDQLEQSFVKYLLKQHHDALTHDQLMQLQNGPNPAISVLTFLHIHNPDHLVDPSSRCPSRALHFAESLIKDVSPACQLLPSSTWPAASQFANHDGNLSTDLLTCLGCDAPLMAGLLSCSRSVQQLPSAILEGHHTALHLATKALFANIVAIADASTTPLGYETMTITTADPPRPLLDEYLETGHFFPGRPVLRHVPRISFKSPTTKDEDCGGDAGCNKYAKEKGRLGPGVLFVWCPLHRICIGFIVLQRAESPQVVSELLQTRFHTPPSTVIYDNSCNLQTYMLARVPQFCRDVLFLNDGFHYSSHTNCAKTYDSRLFMDSRLKGCTTVIHEQKNKLLARLKGTAPLMRLDSFLGFLLHAVASLNQRENDSRELKALKG